MLRGRGHVCEHGKTDRYPSGGCRACSRNRNRMDPAKRKAKRKDWKNRNRDLVQASEKRRRAKRKQELTNA